MNKSRKKTVTVPKLELLPDTITRGVNTYLKYKFPDLIKQSLLLSNENVNDMIEFCEKGLYPDITEIIREAVNEKIQAIWLRLYQKQQLSLLGKK